MAAHHMQTTCILLQTDNHAKLPILDFYGTDALTGIKTTVSKHWRQYNSNYSDFINPHLGLSSLAHWKLLARWSVALVCNQAEAALWTQQVSPPFETCCLCCLRPSNSSNKSTSSITITTAVFQVTQYPSFCFLHLLWKRNLCGVVTSISSLRHGLHTLTAVPKPVQPSIIKNTRFTALCPGLPGWAGTRKVKPIWILLKQETVSGSGISWGVCKAALCSRQITMPAPTTQFLQAGCPSCRPTNSVKALKATAFHH